MPRKQAMSWEGRPGYRWKKMYKGTMYRVRCGEATNGVPGLNLPENLWTEADSRKAANEWWQRKLADLLQVKYKPEAADRLANLQKKIAWAAANDPSLLSNLEHIQQEIEQNGNELNYGEFPLDDFEKILETLRRAAQFGIEIELPEDMTSVPPELMQQIFGDGKLWHERLNTTATLPIERTLTRQGKDFLAVIVGKLQPKSYDEIKVFIDGMKGLTDEQGRIMPEDVQAISEATVERIYLCLDRSGLSDGAKKKRWGFYKRFVGYLIQKKLIESPGNLHSPELRFTVSPKAIKTYSVEEVKTALAKLPTRLRCYAMLAFNCGMNNVDIGTLRHDQIKDGYLKRTRHKLAELKDAPIVTYRLWPTTLALLEECCSNDPVLVLTSSTGTPLWESWIDEGEVKEKDLIKTSWQKANCAITLKAYRSIGATALEDHEIYGRYANHFLANSPKSIKDKHYAAPSQKIFDQAIEWLGQQFDLA